MAEKAHTHRKRVVVGKIVSLHSSLGDRARLYLKKKKKSKEKKLNNEVFKNFQMWGNFLKWGL